VRFLRALDDVRSGVSDLGRRLSTRYNM